MLCVFLKVCFRWKIPESPRKVKAKKWNFQDILTKKYYFLGFVGILINIVLDNLNTLNNVNDKNNDSKKQIK